MEGGKQSMSNKAYIIISSVVLAAMITALAACFITGYQSRQERKRRIEHIAIEHTRDFDAAHMY